MANHKLILCLFLLAISMISNARWTGPQGQVCIQVACASNEDEMCTAYSAADARENCPSICGDFGPDCFDGVRTCCLTRN
ncbi:uncharacterized protein BYT42DRAFT_587968 [Radiomyces spectabilis]|uniref:uncharacterized protein n=1 Tax=Radiomyces spectabilis TaxID=64574 RepID=UPI00222075C8|nr:uncharacterized protein BYT42DRAFT_587968 [Radiomyces spectabilis]KAI8366820.1 hypothetical protein BYT42DRAFT_587968 [Radiomyces spectabilis]